MPVIKWDPFKDLISMQDRMNRLVGDYYLKPGFDEHDMRGEWLPAVDIFEDAEAVVIKAEIPEMDMKDIDIKVEDNILRIRGERKLEKEDSRENYHRVERYYGTFNRSFTLPTTVDQEKIKAMYDRGVLKIILPKKEEIKPKKIKIEVT